MGFPHTNTPGLRLQYTLLIILILALLPFLYISFFTHPAADDYFYFLYEGKISFWELFASQYISWSGRYSTNFLFILSQHLLKNPALYQLVPVILIILTIASLYYFIRVFTSRMSLRIVALNASLLYMLVYLSIMPSISQGIYWYSGSCVYQTGIIFSLLYLGLFIGHMNKKYFINKQVHFFLLLSCIIIALGFNEGNTLLVIGLHLLLAWNKVKKENTISLDIFIILITMLIFSMLMLLAPGNTVRGQHFAESHNFFRSLIYTILQTGRFGILWAISPSLILFTLMLFLLFHQYNDKFALLNLSRKSIVFLAGILACIFFIFIFPAYWSTNILGQHRTVNAACFFFLFAWVLLVVSIGFWIPAEKLKKIPVLKEEHLFALTLAVLLSLFVSGNGYSIAADLIRGNIKQFDKEMAEREVFLSLAENKQKVVYIDPVSVKPSSLFVLELSEDSTYWVNLCEAKYFGVKNIVCKKKE